MHPYSRASIASALNSRTLSLHSALGRSKSSRENLLMHAHAALLRWLISCVSSPSSLTRPPKYRNWVVWAITIQKIPCITVKAEYHDSMYQSGRLPTKKCRALPWGLSTTVACLYQSGRLPSKKYRALPWCLNTAVNVTNLKNRYREKLC